MLENLNKFILGQLGDQSGTLWLGSIFYSKDFQLLNYFSFEIFRENPKTVWDFLFSNLYNFIYLSFSFFLGPILSYNLITLIVLSLNSFFLFKLLKFFKVDRKVAFFFSLFFSFIPYFYLHFEHHTLLFIFPSIYGIYITLKTKNMSEKFDFIKLSFAIFVQMLFSIYLGYFLLIYLFLFFLLDLIEYKSLSRIFFFFKSILLFGVFYVLVSFNFILTFFNPESGLVEYKYPDIIEVNQVSSFEFDRAKPLDDFIFFSSRPWYYFLPPSNHLIFGGLTKDIINYFAYEKNLFLFKNHFPYEHSASYIGFFIFITCTLALFNLKNNPNKNKIKRLLIISFIIFLLTMPPVVFIFGYTIYTPSYLLYLLFPMFRTLSRFVVFIHLSLFIVSAIYVSDKIKNLQPQKKNLYLIIISIFVFFEYFLTYKTVYIPKYVEAGSFLSSFNRERNLVAVYPSSFRTEFLLNMYLSKSPQINPSGFNVEELDFDSSRFTRELTECITLKYFYDFKGRLIVIKNPINIANTDLEKFPTIFESSSENITVKDISGLQKICEF